jgi:hypothetical protein
LRRERRSDYQPVATLLSDSPLEGSGLRLRVCGRKSFLLLEFFERFA